MARTEGTLKLSSNIEPRAAAPLDARTVVPTLADLTASGAFPYPYVGMIVSVQSEGKAYMLKALDTTVSDNWQEVGSGSEYTGDGFIINATLDKDDWDSTTRQQTISFVGYDDGMSGVIGMSVDATDEEKAAYSAAAIDVVDRDGIDFTFECVRIPDMDLHVTLFIGGGTGDPTVFTGTMAQWEALTAAQRKQYNTAAILDDENPDTSGIIDNQVVGIENVSVVRANNTQTQQNICIVDMTLELLSTTSSWTKIATTNCSPYNGSEGRITAYSGSTTAPLGYARILSNGDILLYGSYSQNSLIVLIGSFFVN